jgi:transcriptional regulator
MFTPAEFVASEPNFAEKLIQAHPFGLLVSQASGTVLATHLPFLIQKKAENFDLLGHIAAQNPQSQALNHECLAVFQGPQTYISPLWYQNPQNVGTWNYTSVHVYGKMIIFSEKQKVMDFFVKLYQTFDPLALPHLLSQKPQYLGALFDHIVCFQMQVERIECTAKLSQNKSLADRSNIARELKKLGTENSNQIASLMYPE